MRRWYVSTTLTEETKEKGSALINAGKAHPHHVLVSCILLEDTPAQIDVHQTELSSLTPLPQLRENLLDKVVSLGVHIVEGTTYENVNRFPPIYHLLPHVLMADQCRRTSTSIWAAAILTKIKV